MDSGNLPNLISAEGSSELNGTCWIWLFLCAAEFDVFRVKFRARLLKSGLNYNLSLGFTKRSNLVTVDLLIRSWNSVVQITRYMFIQANRGDMLRRQDFVCYRFFRWKTEDGDEPLRNDIHLFFRFSFPYRLPLEFILRVWNLKECLWSKQASTL